MLNFLFCFTYLTAIGITSQIIGVRLPRDAFKPEKFPYRLYAFEKNGLIYEKIGIKYWKNRVPDMSRHSKKMVPKTLPPHATAAQAQALVMETCVAEIVHWLLIVFAVPCFFIWRGPGGAVVFALYAIGNLVFIIIQRYNRPRQAALAAALRKKESGVR